MDLINSIRKKLAKNGLDAIFISGQENVAYITGITGLNTGERESFLFISGNSASLIAFSTTYLLYKKVKNFNPIALSVDFRLSQALNQIIERENIISFAFESENMSHAEYTSLKNKIKAEILPISGFIEEYRLIKSEIEIQKIAKAAEITDEAFKFGLRQIKEGISEKELALKIEFFIRQISGNISFSPIIAFNDNSAIPHYLPSESIKLKKNSLILIDIGAKFENYCADLSRVVFFGKPKPEYLKIYNTVAKARDSAISTLKTGISGEKVDEIARKVISDAKFPAYSHGLGHGVGLAIHEAPRLRPNIRDILRENMVFTVEPGIYIEGLAGVRIEDLLVLRKDGPELLSKASREIIVL